MQSFWKWFWGEAGAAWIFGFLGLLGFLYTLLRRERPPRVIIQELYRMRLLAIHPSQREKLTVLYSTDQQSHNIESLEQKKIAFYNNGTQNISGEIELRLNVYEGGSEESLQGFWRLIRDIIEIIQNRLNPERDHSEQIFEGFWQLVFDANAPACTAEPIIDDERGASVGIRIKIPFLNSYPIHKHYVTAYLISDREIELKLSEGVGQNWSAYFVGLNRMSTVQRWISRITSGVVLFTLLLSLGIVLALSVQEYKGPYWQAVYNPTDGNIEVAVEEYEASIPDKVQALKDRLESLKDLNMPFRYLNEFLYIDTGVALLFFTLVVVYLYIGFIYLRGAHRIAHRYLGTKPASNFER